jgi:hypothetical protein
MLPSVSGSLRRRLDDLATHRPVLVALWGAAALLALACLIGWLSGPADAADQIPRDVARLQPGQEHRSDELAVTVHDAFVTDEFPGQLSVSEPGNHLVAVRATVEVLLDEPVHLVDDVAGIHVAGGGTPDGDADAVLYAGSGRWIESLQPHLPYELLLVWEVAPDVVDAGTELRVSLWDRHLTSDPGTTEYWGDHTWGALVMPVPVAAGPA